MCSSWGSLSVFYRQRKFFTNFQQRGAMHLFFTFQGYGRRCHTNFQTVFSSSKATIGHNGFPCRHGPRARSTILSTTHLIGARGQLRGALSMLFKSSIAIIPCTCLGIIFITSCQGIGCQVTSNMASNIFNRIGCRAMGRYVTTSCRDVTITYGECVLFVNGQNRVNGGFVYRKDWLCFITTFGITGLTRLGRNVHRLQRAFHLLLWGSRGFHHFKFCVYIFGKRGLGLYLRWNGKYTRLVYNVPHRLPLHHRPLIGPFGRVIGEVTRLFRFKRSILTSFRVKRVVQLGFFHLQDREAGQLRYLATSGVHGRATRRDCYYHCVPVNYIGQLLDAIRCSYGISIAILTFKVGQVKLATLHVTTDKCFATCKIRVSLTKVTSGAVRRRTNSACWGYNRCYGSPLWEWVLRFLFSVA